MFEIASHPLLAIIILLGILVFVHELGHFLVGKAAGIGVEIFSIGFGPSLLSFNYKGTKYTLSLIPLGGYVKFAGSFPTEEVPSQFKGKEFTNASKRARALTIIAGPAANFLLTVLIYTVLVSSGIKHMAPVVGQVRDASPAQQAGIKTGDRILSIDEKQIKTWQDMQKIVSAAAGKDLVFQLERKGESFSQVLVPESVKVDEHTKTGRIGIGYGFLPAKVTVLPGSVAESSRFKTGASFSKLSFGANSLELTSWTDLLDALKLAYTQEATELVFTLSKEASLNKESELKISTKSWYSSKEQTQNGEQLAQVLGFVDSQLTIEKAEPLVDGVLQKGDRLLSFNGVVVQDIYSLSEQMNLNLSSKTQVEVIRADKVHKFEVQLEAVELQKPSGKHIYYKLPVSFIASLVPPEPYIEKADNLFSALSYGFVTTCELSVFLVETIAGLFSGAVPLQSLGGPILIAKVAEESARLGWQAFLTSMALISINLAVINMFPIPVLDGGQLLLVGVEALRRRRLSPSAIENYQKIGFVMVLSLVVLATYNDLSRFWTSIIKGLLGEQP